MSQSFLASFVILTKWNKSGSKIHHKWSSPHATITIPFSFFWWTCWSIKLLHAIVRGCRKKKQCCHQINLCMSSSLLSHCNPSTPSPFFVHCQQKSFRDPSCACLTHFKCLDPDTQFSKRPVHLVSLIFPNKPTRTPLLLFGTERMAFRLLLRRTKCNVSQRSLGVCHLGQMLLKPMSLKPEKSTKTQMSLRPIFRRLNFGGSGE